MINVFDVYLLADFDYGICQNVMLIACFIIGDSMMFLWCETLWTRKHHQTRKHLSNQLLSNFVEPVWTVVSISVDMRSRGNSLRRSQPFHRVVVFCCMYGGWDGVLHTVVVSGGLNLCFLSIVLNRSAHSTTQDIFQHFLAFIFKPERLLHKIISEDQRFVKYSHQHQQPCLIQIHQNLLSSPFRWSCSKATD